MTIEEIVPYIIMGLGLVIVFIDKQRERLSHRRSLEELKLQLTTIEDRLSICARALLADGRAPNPRQQNIKVHTLLKREAR